MFEFNRQVVRQVNSARTQPKNASSKIKNALQDKFFGFQMHSFGKIIETFEGVEALEDFQQYMNKNISVGSLTHSKALDQAAQTIAQQKGRQGKTENQKPKLIYQKIQQFGKVDGKIGELMCLTASSADEIATYFLIDDGLASRKRRRMLLDPVYRYMGVGHAAHSTFGLITVILLAETLQQKQNYWLQASRLTSKTNNQELQNSKMTFQGQQQQRNSQYISESRFSQRR